MKTRLHLTPADAGRPLTLEEFLEAEYEECGRKYELVEGRLEVSPEARYAHWHHQLWLLHALHRYWVEHPEAINMVVPGGRVFVPSLPRRTTCPEPDLTAYRGFPVHLPPSEVDWDDVSPVLVAEVITPGGEHKDLDRNRRLYLRVASIVEYWTIDTRQDFNNPSLIVLRRRGTRWARPQVVASGGTYATPLLPGFTLVVTPRQPAQ